MSNFSRIPFTEIVERTQNEIIRDKAQDTISESKYKGAVNDVYMTDLLALLPEDFLRTTGVITTKEDYSTGTITVAVAGATIAGSSTLWTSANSDGALFKANDTGTVYRVAYTGASTLTLSSPAAWVDAAVTAGSYRLVFDRYALASDFSRMCIDKQRRQTGPPGPEAVYYYNNGSPMYMNPRDNGEFGQKSLFTYGTPSDYTVKYILGVPYLYIFPADTTSRAIFYDYIPVLTPMTEYTTGTASCTNGATAVTGAGTDFDGYITSTDTYYLRFDDDGVGAASVWYQVASAGSDTAITLSTAYAGVTKAAGSSYTISRISRWPARYDQAMMYGAAMKMDPEALMSQKWQTIYTSLVMGQAGFDGRGLQGRHAAWMRT